MKTKSCVFVFLYFLFQNVMGDQFGLKVKRIECNSESEITSVDWLCEMKPLRRNIASVTNSGKPFKDNIYAKLELQIQQDDSWMPYLFNRTINVCDVHETLTRTIPNYKYMSLFFGTAAREICPIINQLPLRNVVMEKIELPSNMPTGNYRLDASIVNDEMEQYLDLNVFFSIKSFSMFSFLQKNQNDGTIGQGQNPNQNVNNRNTNYNGQGPVPNNNGGGRRNGGGGGYGGGNVEGGRRNGQYSSDNF